MFGEEINLNFGQALGELKAGRRVRRAGWNGKNMCLYYVKGTTVPVADLRGNCKVAVLLRNAECYGGKAADMETQTICGHIDMIAADGSVVVGWLASQTDMLADDWESDRIN